MFQNTNQTNNLIIDLYVSNRVARDCFDFRNDHVPSLPLHSPSKVTLGATNANQ